MEEMQTMMRLTFELQLDMQRSIRQEVAAALSGQHGQGQNNIQTQLISFRDGVTDWLFFIVMLSSRPHYKTDTINVSCENFS